MKNEKEVWVERMMEYAAKPSSSTRSKEKVFHTILDILERPEGTNNIISFSQFRLVGIASLIILALNIGVIGFTIVSNNDKAESKSAYGLHEYNLDLY